MSIRSVGEGKRRSKSSIKGMSEKLVVPRLSCARSPSLSLSPSLLFRLLLDEHDDEKLSVKLKS